MTPTTTTTRTRLRGADLTAMGELLKSRIPRLLYITYCESTEDEYRAIGRVYVYEPPDASRRTRRVRPSIVVLDKRNLCIHDEGHWTSIVPIKVSLISAKTSQREDLDEGSIFVGRDGESCFFARDDSNIFERLRARDPCFDDFVEYNYAVTDATSGEFLEFRATPNAPFATLRLTNAQTNDPRRMRMEDWEGRDVGATSDELLDLLATVKRCNALLIERLLESMKN